jgi:hypothetical protein
VEWFSGKLWTGPLALNRSFALDDIPVFVKAGSIIPQLPVNDKLLLGSAQAFPSALQLNVFAFPNGKGNSSIFEDDGNTTSYLSGQGVWTTVTYSQQTTTKINVAVRTTGGSFPGYSATRSLVFKVIGVFNPTTVSLNGQSVPFDPFISSTPSWSFDGDALAIVITTNPIPTTSVSLDIELSSSITSALLDGFTLQVNRAKTVKALLDGAFPFAWQEDYTAVINAASTGYRISANPSTARTELTAFPALLAQAIDQILAIPILDPKLQNTTLSLLKDAQSISSNKPTKINILQDEL